MNFAQQESLYKNKERYYKCYDKGKVDVINFWDKNRFFFNAGTW